MKQIDGYQVVQHDQGLGNVLLLTSRWKDEYSRVIRARKITVLRLTEYVGWTDSAVSFVLKVPEIQGVEILSRKVVDVSPVFQLGKLKTLCLCCPAKAGGDFGKFQHLQSIFLSWRNVYRSVFTLDALVRINILDYPDKDLTGWKRNDRLKKLSLSSKKLERLTGIERFRNVERLDLFRCRKLDSLSELAHSTSLRSLRLNQCPSIVDLSPISHLPELRELEIENCGEMHSIAPVAKCKKLQRLQIAGNTTVLDGDLSDLKRLPNLKEVLLAKRKHYSHTDEELERK